MHSEHQPSTVGWIIGIIKSLLMVTIALAGLALFLAWMSGSFDHKTEPGVVPLERPEATGREIVTGEKSVNQETITAVGTVQPRRKTEVASQLLATIREIKYRPGDRVKQGEVLVILDDRELTAQQREASASLASAEADLSTRKSDYERVKALRERGSASAEELNRVEGAYRITEAQVNRAKEMINRIEVQQTYTRITATTDGIVSDRMAEPGDLATPGKPLLSVYDPNDLELQVNVPESLAAGIKIGQKLEIRIDANNWSSSAVIREIVPFAQQASRSVLVKLGLTPSPSIAVLPGMFGRAAVPIGQVERVWLPRKTILTRGQLDLVEVVGADNRLVRRFVRLGRTVNDQVEVLSGLAPGERVAVPAENQQH
jgi:RND family efflux transporter MFP subunit